MSGSPATLTKQVIFIVCQMHLADYLISSCHVFIRILAVSRLHLIDPSLIEHNSACIII